MSSLRDLLNGMQRHPFKLLANAFTAFSVIQTIVRGVSLFVPGISIGGPIPLFAVFLFSVGWGTRKVWKPSRIEVPVANCGTVIEVLFGDLFEQDGIRAIAVIESASMFLKLSLRIAVSFVVMDYGNRPRGSVESSVKPC